MVGVPLPPLLIAERSSLSLPMMEEAMMEEETNAEAPGATTFGQMARDVQNKMRIYLLISYYFKMNM
jgi:hypothetical protein